MKKLLLIIAFFVLLLGLGVAGYSYKSYRDDQQIGVKIKSVAKKATVVKKDIPAATVEGDTNKEIAYEAQRNFQPETDFTVDWSY